MRVFVFLCLLALFSFAAFSQPPLMVRPPAVPTTPSTSNPKFEVTQIRTSPASNMGLPNVIRGPFYGDGRYEIRNASMADLIGVAYNVDSDKIFGGPSWLEFDRFDVFGKVVGNSSVDSRRKMLQALLADRFKLSVHEDKKPVAVFALTSKKPLMKPAEDNGQGHCDFNLQQAPAPPSNPNGTSQPNVINVPTIIYTCHNTTMEAFAAEITGVPSGNQYFGDKAVVDQTSLEGAFDFTLRFTPKLPAGVTTTGENIPLFDAVDKQLGLKLEAATVPMPVFNVEKVNETPTPDAPDAAKTFPPLPEEFEVAEIKVSPPQDPSKILQPEVRNGRLYLPGIPLQFLVMVAWNMNSPDFVVGPKWMNDARFDIVAKAPPGVALGEFKISRDKFPVNIDALQPMLRTLLTDRFKIVSHMEDRPMPAYTLSAGKPKMAKADPAERTKWHEGAASPDSKDKNANPGLGRLVTCQNVTMAQFVKMLPNIAPGYIRTDVKDATGLEGGYDFTFSFSPVGAVNGGGGRSGDGGSNGPVEASTPNGAVSLFDALQKELGLKLETQKRPTPVLVIDKIEQKPIDN